MIELKVINEINGRSFGSIWESKAEKDQYVAKQIAKQSWGKPERYIDEADISEGLRSRIISTEITDVSTVHLVKADYVITEVDLSQSSEYRNEQQIESRKAEYKSIEEVIHIILDKGMDSQEFIDLQSERQAIKAKYPKE